MPVMISMLRGVNVGGHNKIKMDALRDLCESLRLQDVQTHIQSGNIIFRTEKRDTVSLARSLEDAIERKFGFRADVVVRTVSELKEAIAKNPFAGRRGLDPSKLLVTFLGGEPDADARRNVLNIKADPEEMYVCGRELYIYFPNGMARPQLSWMAVVKALKTTGTGRNWNTVTKLLELAEKPGDSRNAKPKVKS